MKDDPETGSQTFRLSHHLASAKSLVLHLNLRYHELAKWLFITLAFTGLLSTGWFGIPLVPEYLTTHHINLLYGIFALFSALGTIWGVMAYREFSRSILTIVEARAAARRLDPMIGDYEYRSYDPSTREYEAGFVPVGAIDFWDKETHVPPWMDKGKYWHLVLNLQSGDREIRIQVVKDTDLGYRGGRGFAAMTVRQLVQAEYGGGRRARYIVKIPQWLVMNTERDRFSHSDIPSAELSGQIATLNKSIVAASEEVTDWEGQRIRYPWKLATLGIYLNKSLPLRLVYGQVIRNFPGAKRRKISEANNNLANIKDYDLESALLVLAQEKGGIRQDRIQRINMLLRFLKNAYARQGLGEGASEYHSFHHSLEVSYMAIHMLPKSFQLYTFDSRDFEVMLVASLLHDYDPEQATFLRGNPGARKGPSVTRTMNELERSRILEAYFILKLDDLARYFQDFNSRSSPEFSATNPEMVPPEVIEPVEVSLVELLIWRTDFPFNRQKTAQEKYAGLIAQLAARGTDVGKVNLMAEILWLADLAVTYMGSDPVRAWDRVNNLYNELNLPKLEAMSGTDAFFGDFAKNEVFQQVIKMRQFPPVFRQRWEAIFNFFHEGNPSTQINRNVESARKLYNKVNLELGLRRGELLEAIASEHFFEYFIGIGRDQREVFKAKARFSEMDPQNASAYWGDIEKLVPGLDRRSIDNFLMVMPKSAAPLYSESQRESLRILLKNARDKLVVGGAVRILTDLQPDDPATKVLEELASKTGFELSYDGGKPYFPEGWRDVDFAAESTPHVFVLHPAAKT